MNPDTNFMLNPERNVNESKFRAVFEQIAAKYDDLIMEYDNIVEINYSSEDIFTEQNLEDLYNDSSPAAKLQVKAINTLKERYGVNTAEEAFKLHNDEKDIVSATSVCILVNISSPFTFSGVEILEYKLKVQQALAEVYNSAVRNNAKTYLEGNSEFQVEFEDITLIKDDFPEEWMEGTNPSGEQESHPMKGSTSVQLKDGLVIVFE